MNTKNKYHLNMWVTHDIEVAVKRLAERHGLSISKAAAMLLVKGIEANKQT